MSQPLIECCCCRECFPPEEIDYALLGMVPFTVDRATREDLQKLADEGYRFDCPKCEEPMYLSDCEIL